jgi:hypothetical protein
MLAIVWWFAWLIIEVFCLHLFLSGFLSLSFFLINPLNLTILIACVHSLFKVGIRRWFIRLRCHIVTLWILIILIFFLRKLLLFWLTLRATLKGFQSLGFDVNKVSFLFLGYLFLELVKLLLNIFLAIIRQNALFWYSLILFIIITCSKISLVL